MTSSELELAYGDLPVMIWTAGPNQACDYVNERWLEFTGRGLEAELGFGWTDRVHPDDRSRCLVRHAEAFQAKRAFSREYRMRRADGEYRWLLDTAVPRYDATGEFIGFLGCCADVTEQRALEQRAAGEERVTALALLAGGVAHDFNNLLTGILWHAAMLEEDAALAPQARADLDQIRQSAERATGLTRQLLAFGRRQVLAPRALDLGRMLAEAEAGIRRLLGRRIELVIQAGSDLDPVLADPSQLERVLLELAAHAREAMPEGGRLELSTARARVAPEPAEQRGGLHPGSYMTLTVRDSGKGLDPAALTRVFEPRFGGGADSGSELGLSAVYGIVRQSGGHITAESTPGQGTSFTIYLPSLEPRVARAAATGDTAGGSETILLVEDERPVRELARRVLQRAGYTVLEAGSGEAAIDLADRHPGEIHLLLSDVVLPRLSGRELAARLGIHRPAIKVLYISGTADGAIARHRLLDPGTEFLEKPFPLDRLLTRVRRVLGPVAGQRQP